MRKERQKTTLLLVRHGETDWNLEKRLQGHKNISLNQKGRDQANSLAEKLAVNHRDIAAIYSSDLDRAYQTAHETSKRLGLSIQTRERLREIRYGVAEGLTQHEKNERFGPLEKLLDEKYSDQNERRNHTAIPGAETHNQVIERAKNELHQIALSHTGSKVIVFTHGFFIRILIQEGLNQQVIHPNNCSLAHFSHCHEAEESPLSFLMLEEILPPC